MLRTVVLLAFLGSTLLGWPGWPRTEFARGAVEVGAPCAAVTRRWAETWRPAPIVDQNVRRLSVLCQPDGTTHAATFSFWLSERGPGRVVWRPVITYFGPVPPRALERVDIFDHSGHLTEYATVDRHAGRVEFFSSASRPTGQGILDVSSGRVERFSLDGDRRGSLLLPLPPAL